MTPFSVIIPAYNEEHGITAVINAVHALHLPCEIIVVDDGSTDGTAQVAEKAGATVLRHPANGGYGLSLKDGIRAAKHDIIVITDADGSYPAHRMPDLIAEMSKGFDMVVGARQGMKQLDSLLKAPARLVFKFLVEFTTGSHIPDVNSGLRAFRKSQVMPYFPDLCQGFSFTTTITLIYKLTGKFVCYVPIDYQKRVGHSKVHIIHDSLRSLQYITEVIATYNPLKLFLLLTGLLDLGALAAFIWWLLSPHTALVIVGSTFFVGSIILFAMGLIAFTFRRRT